MNLLIHLGAIFTILTILGLVDHQGICINYVR